MKLKCLITACLLAFAPFALSAQDLYIGQYNIRNANAKDSFMIVISLEGAGTLTDSNGYNLNLKEGESVVQRWCDPIQKTHSRRLECVFMVTPTGFKPVTF